MVDSGSGRRIGVIESREREERVSRGKRDKGEKATHGCAKYLDTRPFVKCMAGYAPRFRRMAV